MNTFDAIKKTLVAGLVLSAAALAGCQAQGDASDLPPGAGGGGGGVTDVVNCDVALSNLCVLGGDKHSGGLVDVLLAPNGPLGPIAGAIDTTELTAALVTLLQNDGTLTSSLTGLLADGHLAEGLQQLLLGVDGTGNNGLASVIQGVLTPNAQGQGLISLFGENGIQGLVMALLTDGTSSDCQAPLGTLCLIAGSGTDQVGLVDLLATSEGLLGSLSPTLTNGVTDDVVEILGNLLASNGSLPDLLTGLIQDGQLVTALQVLLVGDADAGVPSGLAQALQSLLGNLGTSVSEVVTNILGILGLGT